MKELHVEAPPSSPSWDDLRERFFELVYEGIPLPEDLSTYLREEFGAPPEGLAAPNQAKAAWEAYKGWVGDIVEDPRTPRERLEAYFAAQDAKLEELG